MLARAGAHTGWLEMAWRNNTPRAAIRSRLGVRFMGLSPIAPMQSQRNWSEITRTMLGLLTPPVWPLAAEATAAAAALALNHSRRVCLSAAIDASGGKSIIWRGVVGQTKRLLSSVAQCAASATALHWACDDDCRAGRRAFAPRRARCRVAAASGRRHPDSGRGGENGALAGAPVPADRRCGRAGTAHPRGVAAAELATRSRGDFLRSAGSRAGGAIARLPECALSGRAQVR